MEGRVLSKRSKTVAEGGTGQVEDPRPPTRSRKYVLQTGRSTKGRTTNRRVPGPFGFYGEAGPVTHRPRGDVGPFIAGKRATVSSNCGSSTRTMRFVDGSDPLNGSRRPLKEDL